MKTHAHQQDYAVADTDDPPPLSGGADKPPPGSHLRVDFACPECGASGWVMWAKLARVMRCYNCRTRFWMDRTGHLVSERQSRSVKFTCPRCRHQDALPERLLPTAIACPACETHLELNASGVATGSEASPAAIRSRSAGRGHAVAQRRRLFAAAAVGVVVGLVALASVYFGLMGRSTASGSRASQSDVDTAARQFTRLCLQGRLEQAARFVLPDQHEYLQRWLAFWHPALPALDDSTAVQADISLQTIQKHHDRAVLYVKVELDSRRSIGLTQQWVLTSDGWLLDAAAMFRAIAQGGD